ncbi:hypothetical protein KEM56_005737 [Ascosphaera pollenicola]|nr:hypothetical protein KEM56_005737 [Ascosphaera pollenicola]
MSSTTFRPITLWSILAQLRHYNASLRPVAHMKSFELLTLASVLVPALASPIPGQKPITSVQLGPRPFYLIDDMSASSLKSKLQGCAETPPTASDFSISHRGAPLQFSEHSEQGWRAAARMGAGVIECDATFTKDRELVCRHSMCDLHSTTNILTKPELAKKCTKHFEPADPKTGKKASAKCCTTDITLAEFKSLCAKQEE